MYAHCLSIWLNVLYLIPFDAANRAEMYHTFHHLQFSTFCLAISSSCSPVPVTICSVFTTKA